MARGYSVTNIDLSVAGLQRISQEAGYLLFMDAVNAAGIQQLDALVEIAFGAYPGEWLPFRLNNKVEGYFGDVTLRWVAQSGWTAKFYQSRGTKADYDLMPLRLDTPPAKQLVTSSLASNMATGQVVVLTTATLIAAARSTRQAISVFTRTVGAILFVGGANTVTINNGHYVGTQASWWTDKYNGALWGITDSPSVVTYEEEY
jgi:hypothetical protein